MNRTSVIRYRAGGRVGSVGDTVDKGVETAKSDFTNILLLLGGGFGLWLLLQYGAPAGYKAASHTKHAYRKYREAGAPAAAARRDTIVIEPDEVIQPMRRHPYYS